MGKIKIEKHENDLLSFSIHGKVYTVGVDIAESDDVTVCFSSKNVDGTFEIFKFDRDFEENKK